MDKVCKNCVYWEKPKDTIGFGICQLITTIWDAYKFVKIDSEDINSKLKTEPGWCCADWMERESK